jgi:hypothetical protein
MSGLFGGLIQCGEELFREREAAEEKRAVDGVTGKGVAEQGQACEVTHGESGRRVGVRAEELPDSEVGDEEKLERTEENGPANAEHAAVIGEQGSDEHADQKARVHNGDEVVEADEEIAGKKSHKWEEKGHAAIAEHCTGEERHGADGREIPRMWKDAHHRGENDHNGGENGAKHKNMSGRFFLEHDSNQTSL